MLRTTLTLALLFLLACQPVVKEAPLKTGKTAPYEHPIPFAPREYVCYRATEPLLIDGKITESDWQRAPWTEDFVDIEGNLKPTPKYRTRAKMLWDDQYFYFAAEIEEPHIWATITERDAVMYQNDDFEIFIDPDGDGHRYYEFEMNANNAIWDLFMLEPYRVDTFPAKYLNDWDIKGIKTGVAVAGTVNDPSDEDKYWRVEVAMPWEALKAVAPEMRQPEAGEQWRVNFSRVDWWMDIVDGKYQKQTDPNTGEVKRWPEENWVWSPSGRVDMHQPETWGYVQFSNAQVGTKEEGFSAKPEEKIKWALWQLYHQQRVFYKEHGYYASEVVPPEVDLPNYTFDPVVETTHSLFEIRAAALDGGTWHIRQDGRIWKSGSQLGID